MPRPTRLLLAALLAATPLSATLAQPAATSAIPPLAYTERTLPNGLKVYAMRDTSSPNVSVQVWYDVGSKDDPRGRSGFAHLFEHLMFKATRNMPAETVDRLTEDVGGFNNASTWDDFTNYYETVPANHLQRLLWAEAERMGSLVVDNANFLPERDVVKEELRTGLARPYGRLFSHYVPMVSYQRHPYARPGIGSIEELDAATIDDVRAFHATYYRPDNAVLVVSGNFDPAQLNGWVDSYFAPIKRPATRIPRVTAAEPARTAARTYTVTEPNTPLPAVVMSFLVPPSRSPDSAPLEVLQTILASGDSSRLDEALIRTRLATDADIYAEEKQSTGLFAPYAILAGGKTVAEVEAVLRRELARLAREPVTAAELTEARNELTTAALKERETVDGKAVALARGVLIDNDPRAADERLAAIARVSAADVQRVAAKYLDANRAVTIRYLPAPKGTTVSGGDKIALAPTVVTTPLAAPKGIKLVQEASAAERVQPPAPAAPVDVAVPQPVTARLANGLTVITVPRSNLPLVSATLLSTEGAASDPANQAGLHNLAATLLTKGTKTRSATQIAAAVEALGGQLGSAAGTEGMTLDVTVPTPQLSAALAIMADAAVNSTFSAEELERARGQAIDETTVALQSPGPLSRLAADRALFGTHPYGSPATGTPESLKVIDRTAVVAAASSALRPDRSVLVLAGDITPNRARQLAETAFREWQVAGGPTPPPVTPSLTGTAPLRGKIVVVDMPGSAQAAVAVTRETIARSDPRYYSTLVANAVLGGGYSSRLNREIRIKRGLSYGASSGLSAARQTGDITAAVQTKNQSAAEVLGLILAEMRRLGTEPIPAAEMGTRQANIAGGFGRQLETVEGLGGIVATYVQSGVDPSEIGRFMSSVRAITPAQASEAARGLLTDQGATTVIVGDAKLFTDDLRKRFGDVTVIPLADLKLDSPSLR
ncbi:insulinase family protein [Sphingomonas sp. BN140010]|uniref:Insulinase family protein n=1 Tax=Sphingomonas arvum TaxID=2992113 RepID=A0ABT3JFY1_9SPHN|nr:pitrilysin family protein [Sphingomonas sp. BN140010]MCW3797909.1 insulinase family protein [Sphingomonas sp. BN140010]